MNVQQCVCAIFVALLNVIATFRCVPGRAQMNDGAAVKCDTQAIDQVDVLFCAYTFKERCARGFIHCATELCS